MSCDLKSCTTDTVERPVINFLPIFLSFILYFFLAPVNLEAQINVEAGSDSVGVWNVYELTIGHAFDYSNNWEDVKVSAAFQGPQTISVHGFYYDSHTWKVRFAPPASGNWSYHITFITPTQTFTADGKFTCVASERKGFLKRHPNDPFRLIYPDGTLFNGLGFEDCALDFNNDGTPLDDFGFDGGFAAPGALGSRTDLKTYMTAYGSQGAGFNLFRWTTNNCSFGLYNTIADTGNTYLIKEGKFGDTIVNSLLANNIRVWLTFFGPPVFPNIDGTTPLHNAAIERYIDYVVARYGAYVDIWELFNESTASLYYYNAITAYLRSIDPYHRLISVSDERPDLACIDINSPHWYQKESELESDAVAWSMITGKKSFGKPIIFGEQGNSIQNWDPLSAERMRLRDWTAFFAEGILIFWNTSYAKNYMHPISANIYLGPQERGYIKALNNFSSRVDSAARPFRILPQNGSQVRAYGLGSLNALFGYFHHYNTHADNVSTSFNIRLHKPGTIFWINPADNTVINSQSLPFGTQTITSPAFNVDIAMRIIVDGADYIFDDSQRLDLIVYPNPATSEFSVDGNFNGLATVNVFNAKGEKIMSKSGVGNDQPINIKHLANGVYIYHVTADQRQSTGKLIILNH